MLAWLAGAALAPIAVASSKASADAVISAQPRSARLRGFRGLASRDVRGIYRHYVGRRTVSHTRQLTAMSSTLSPAGTVALTVALRPTFRGREHETGLLPARAHTHTRSFPLTPARRVSLNT